MSSEEAEQGQEAGSHQCGTSVTQVGAQRRGSVALLSGELPVTRGMQAEIRWAGPGVLLPLPFLEGHHFSA